MKSEKTAAHPLAQTVAELRSGQRDLKDYVADCCRRIDEWDGDIRAMLPEANRLQRLLHDAAGLVSSGEIPPLFGTLVGVKDIFHVEGFETRAGSGVPSEVLTGPEGGCIKALREAGALVLGKAVTTEFACFKPGVTRNPRNLSFTPGGSSSGSAAAVTAGYCPLALGSQTIGSVIRPAAFCGIVGFKPSYARIDISGFVHCSPSVDTIGMFTQDVAGMEMAAAVLCSGWRASVARLKKPALGIPIGPYLDQTESRARADFDAQIQALRTVGYNVVEVRMLDDIADINDRHRNMMKGEMAEVHAPWFDKYASTYDAGTRALVEEGRALSQSEIDVGRVGRIELRAEVESLMQAEGIDLLACPAATGAALKGLGSTGDPCMNLPWTHTGMPVIALPAGLASDSGMPLGIQFVAPFHQDEALLAWAALLERDL
ncbi:MAG: amidase [Gemmatimonadetes bacterium]|nr:amidase [Gemmatimonadota bacterium]